MILAVNNLGDNLHMSVVGALKLKVSKFRKQILVSSILPKNQKKIDLKYHSTVRSNFFPGFLFIFWEN